MLKQFGSGNSYWDDRSVFRNGMDASYDALVPYWEKLQRRKKEKMFT
jgi:hypothetical protein